MRKPVPIPMQTRFAQRPLATQPKPCMVQPRQLPPPRQPNPCMVQPPPRQVPPPRMHQSLLGFLTCFLALVPNYQHIKSSKRMWEIPLFFLWFAGIVEWKKAMLTWICLATMLGRSNKTYSPKWCFNGDLPWYKVKSHLHLLPVVTFW